MVNRKPRTVWFRRKREQKTDYSRRRSLLMSRKPRLVVRLTNTKIIAQLVTYSAAGDQVVLGIDSGRLGKFGWNYSHKNLPAAYLTGLLLGKLADKKNIHEVILDTGFRYPHPGGKIYAVLKGAVEGGLQVPHSPDIFPATDRMRGAHIAHHASFLTGKKEAAHHFAQYLKSNAPPAQMAGLCEQVKKKIMGS